MKYNLNTRMVANILLLSHVGISCSNHYNIEVKQDLLHEKTTTTSIVGFSQGHISAFTPFVKGGSLEAGKAESSCQVSSQELKEVVYQKSNPVFATLALRKRKPTKIEKSTTVSISLAGNNNSEQLNKQKAVGSSFSNLTSAVKETKAWIQFYTGATKEQSNLQGQENTTPTQIGEVTQVDQRQVQQGHNQVPYTPSLSKFSRAVNWMVDHSWLIMTVNSILIFVCIKTLEAKMKNIEKEATTMRDLYDQYQLYCRSHHCAR